MIKILIPRFIGSDIEGTNTSPKQIIMKNIGIIRLTFIGLGRSGLEDEKDETKINSILIVSSQKNS